MPPPRSTTRFRELSRGPAPRACLAAAACLAATACASASGGSSGTASPAGDRTAEADRAERAESPPADADVAFMRGMIHHHAQAVAMARLVPDRVAAPAVRRLSARILNSQRTEIELMADWLRDRDEPVPEVAARAVAAAGEGGSEDAGADGSGDGGAGGAAPAGLAPPGGWDEGPQMPGVLSDEQMDRLEGARGEEFDRLFLTFMIEHHDGAVDMVEELVRSPDGAREETVFRLASGIRADQSTEIDRMRDMLRQTLFGPDGDAQR